MVLGNIIETLPSVIPRGIIEESEDKTFTEVEFENGSTEPKLEYVMNKAPVESVDEITGIVNDNQYTFVRNTDYRVRDRDGDGGADTIVFRDTANSTLPDLGSTFTISYRAQSIISRYLDAYGEQTESYSDTIDDVIKSHQIDNAEGAELDRIGSLFGELGRRRGRTDTEYRILLKSIVQSFSGRGTKPGMKFAIAAGVGTDPENIVIDEDFTQTGYSIQINDVDTDFLSDVIIYLAELADPSGVELLNDPFINAGGTTHIVNHTEATVVSTDSGLGSGTLTLDGNSTLQ